MKGLKDYTETELKALAYDNFATVESSQNNLKLINEELARRQSAPIMKAEKKKV